jgi:hypothetical protein
MFMDFLAILVAFVFGVVLFGLLLLLTGVVERTAPEQAVRFVSGSARQPVPSA